MASAPNPPGLDLRTICNALGGVERKWFKIGVQLGIPRAKLQEFKQEDDPLSAVVDHWERNVTETTSPKSWSTIVTALESEYIGEPGLAEKIREKYCQSGIQEETSIESGKQDTSAKTDTNGVSSAQNQSSLPSVINQTIREDLKHVLQKNLKNIQAKYASYVDCIRAAIKEKGVDPEDFCSFLMSLPACANNTERQTLTLLSDIELELEKCTTITAIFDILKKRCTSFLNCDIYQNIVTHYSINEDQEKMKYPQHLKAYVEKHNISEFTKINPQLKEKSKSNSQELILKCDIETTCRLAKVFELKYFLAEIMDLSPSALEIVNIEDGCVVVTFMIPSSVADTFFTPDTVFTPQQEQKLRANAVLWIKCNGFSYEKDSQGHKAIQIIKEHVTCSICLGNYTNPKVLQCLHAFCLQCLEPLQQDQQGQITLTCPECRQVTPVPPTGVAGLQTDFRSNELLEILGKKPAASNDSSLEKKSVNAVQNWMPLSHDSQEESQIIEKEISSLEQMEKSLIMNLEAFEARRNEISSQVVTIKTDIKEKFRHLHAKMQAREEEIVQQLQKINEEKLQNLAAERGKVEIAQAQLSSYLQFLRESLKTDNLEEALQGKELAATALFHLDVLEPSTKADITFKVFDDFGSWCKRKVQVYCSEGPPDPSKCYISTSNVQKISSVVAHKKSTAYLNVMDANNEPTKLNITVKGELVFEITRHKTKVNVERKCGESRYKLTFIPTIKGIHQLHIVADGQHISESPLTVHVKLRAFKKLQAQPVTLEGVYNPQGIAVTEKGLIVVTEQDKHCVTVLNSRGGKLQSFGTQGKNPGQFRYPCGVTVDDEDNIFVADRHNHNIQKFTINGEYISTVGSELGDKPLEFAYPRGITFNSTNKKIYISDSGNSRIQILNSDLSYHGTLREKNYLYNPLDIACDNFGNIYVVDGEKHNIQIFTAEGEVLNSFGKYRRSGELNNPQNLAIDHANRIWVFDKASYRVFVFTMKGELVDSFGSKGKGQEKFENPTGIAVDSCGVVYICDNNRLHFF